MLEFEVVRFSFCIHALPFLVADSFLSIWHWLDPTNIMRRWIDALSIDWGVLTLTSAAMWIISSYCEYQARLEQNLPIRCYRCPSTSPPRSIWEWFSTWASFKFLHCWSWRVELQLHCNDRRMAAWASIGNLVAGSSWEYHWLLLSLIRFGDKENRKKWDWLAGVKRIDLHLWYMSSSLILTLLRGDWTRIWPWLLWLFSWPNGFVVGSMFDFWWWSWLLRWNLFKF